MHFSKYPLFFQMHEAQPVPIRNIEYQQHWREILERHWTAFDQFQPRVCHPVSRKV